MNTIMSSTSPPPDKCKQSHAGNYDDSIYNQKSPSWGFAIHIEDGNRSNCREEEDDTEEGCPTTCPNIDEPRSSSKVDWAGSEVFGPENLSFRTTHSWAYLAKNRDAITPIEGDNTDLMSKRMTVYAH